MIHIWTSSVSQEGSQAGFEIENQAYLEGCSYRVRV
jgi:hypothetical protein